MLVDFRTAATILCDLVNVSLHGGQGGSKNSSSSEGHLGRRSTVELTLLHPSAGKIGLRPHGGVILAAKNTEAPKGC